MKQNKPATWNYDFVKARLAEIGLERRELAKRIGIAKRSLDQTLIGRKPGLGTIKLMAQVLGCTEEELLYPPDRGQQAS
jgi:transcriptional regulator with XRE-family HTH domain